MRTKIQFLFLCLGLTLGTACFVSCGDDDDDVTPEKTGDSYGKLDGNLIATGDANQISYTSAVLLGTVDFSKLDATHTYGVVYMEESDEKDFDYTTQLTYPNVSSKQRPQISSSTAEGKFEKQITVLKPATKYYYRSWIAVGNNYNYSSVKSFSTLDPSDEISMTTSDATDITALGVTMNGTVNIGQLQKVVEEQKQGFVYSPSLKTPETLTYEHYKSWEKNHLETDEEIEEPKFVRTSENLDNIITVPCKGLSPGTTYYYRSVFYWNGKYFYSKDVKSFTTFGEGSLSITTKDATDITITSATLNGSIPFGKIGSSRVTAGFFYSDTYTLASELILDNVGEGVTCKTLNVSEDDFSFALSSLKPNTTYYYRAFIKIDVSGSDPIYIYDRTAKHFKTGEIVVTTKDAEVSGTSAVLNGNMPFSDISSLVETSGFVYSKVYKFASDLSLDNAKTNNYIMEKHYLFMTDDYSITISGLDPTTKYYYRAYIQIKLPDTGEIVTIYAKDVKSFTTEERGSVAEISVSSTGTYHWTQSADGTWMSGNQYKSSTTSTMTVTITHREGDTLTFDWTVSSETNYDKLTCKLGSTTLIQKSGTNSGTYTHTFTSTGTSTMTCSYSKNSSVNSGNDYATIKFIQ